ncbi:hypothetical protein JHL21_13510 [Devosia sp. WQ 349]|uniref:hypothetical protein n=1 Tax=Devosia sp. WQ 349K1 TaxID=2800329 RepID=UPI001906924D|nr:hypothetical protein [Devosia sp. WQ 349K1]MBK1795515.1 hypothetical protein [Devosia sp. WQ 349K1]
MPPASRPTRVKMSDTVLPEHAASSPTTSRTSGQTIVTRLEQVRQRYRWEAVLVVVAAQLPALIALAWTGSWSTLTDISRPVGLLIWCGIALILSIGAFLFWRIPDVDRVARIADTQLGTAERLSSARPMLGDMSKNLGPLGPALLADAVRYSEGLSRVRVGLPRAALGALTVLSVTLCAAVIGWGEAPSRLDLPAAPAQTAEWEVLEALPAEQVDQLRELIEADAKRRNSSYLEAVANSLEQFQQDEPNMSQQERAEKLAGLLDHAASAYGSSRPGWLPQDTANMAALSANLERHAISSSLAANSSPTGSVPLPDEWDPNAADPALRSAESLQDILANAGAAGSVGPLIMGEPGQPVGTPPPSNPFELRALDPAKLMAATPAGASLNADEGASASAGLGSQDLEGEPTQMADVSIGTQMGLSSDIPGQGNLVRIEVAPKTAHTEVDGTVVSAAAPEQRPLLPVFQTAVQPWNRGIVARYFTDDLPAPTGGK